MKTFIKQEIKVVDTTGRAEDFYMYMVLCFEETIKVFELELNTDERENNTYVLPKITDHCRRLGISAISVEEWEDYVNSPWTPITHNHVPEMNAEQYEEHKKNSIHEE